MIDTWYRAEVRRYATIDDWGDVVGTHCEVSISDHKVTATTPRGVWVSLPFGMKRFVLGTAKRQFCLPTKELALKDAIARKKRHIKGCEARLASAKGDLTYLERELSLQQRKEGI